MKGYEEDRTLKRSLESALERLGPLSAANRYYKDERGLLFFRDADWMECLCVPQSQVIPLLKETHDSAFETAHAGPARLYLKLKAHFFWPKMWKEIKAFCETCDVCQKVKPDRRPKAGKLKPLPIPQMPFDIVTLDLVAGLPKSEGADTILVVMDKLTKYASYIPTNETLNQEGFAKLFIKHIVHRFGLPRGMVADCDPHWAKTFWVSVAAELKLDLLLSTSHHPQTDGQSERAIQQLVIGLRAFIRTNRASWAKWLSKLNFAYNSTPLPSIGESPFYLLYGYIPRSPATAIHPGAKGIERLAHNADTNSFIREITAVWQSARDALALAQAKQAEAFNKGRRLDDIQEGDEVLINPHSLELVEVQGQGHKLVQRRIGPFTVLERINDSVYRIDLPPEYRMHPIINADHLVRYRRRDPNVGGETLPELRPTVNEEVYEVEKIVGHRRAGRKGILYRVRWKGYGPEEDMYETEENLRGAFSRLREYKNSQKLPL